MMNQFKTVLLLALLTALLLFAGRLLGGPAGLVVAGILVIAMNVGMYFFSDKLVLAMYRAKEVKDTKHKLYKITKGICEKAHLPMPRVFIIPSEQANAFATGRNPTHAAVAATEGILHLLTDEELEGVMAHEMSHVKNRDILISTIAGTIAGIISYVSQMALFSAMFGGRDDERGNMLGLILLAIITPIVATIIQLAISRSREYMADETGARILRNSKGLAAALDKLHKDGRKHPMRFGNQGTAHLFISNPFTARGMFSLLSTHPPMDERIRRLEALKF